MVLEDIQYRSVIRFLFMKGKSREQVQVELNGVYGVECPSKATMYRWYNMFQSGRISVADEKKSGRPVEIDEK